MIEIPQLVALLRAKAIQTRIAEAEEAWEWARGVYSPAAGTITPSLAGPEHAADYERLVRLVKSVGERALHIKVSAAVGNVTWGDDTPAEGEDPAAFAARKAQLDDQMVPLRLEENARKIAEQWNVDGIIAAHAYLSRQTNQPRLARLTGYLEPYLNPRDMDEVQGLYQAKSALDGHGQTRWWVRVYDWTDTPGGLCTIREWRDLRSPVELGRPPDEETPGAQRPAVRVGPATPEGLIMSRFLTAIPLMRAVMATEMALERGRELAAWPIPVFKNAVEVSVVSPAVPVQVADDGDFYFAQPGNLDQLQARLDDRLRRFGQDMNLPAVQIGANRSGESIREEALAFYNDARGDAALLSDFLTEAVERYAEVSDVEPVPVGVSPNMEYIREQIIQSVVLLVDKGLLPRAVAMREVQPFFPTFSDDELQKAIDAAESFVTPEDALAALGEADGG